MKTAVSLPEQLFRDADRLAKRLRRSRSSVYADAIAEYLAKHDADNVTARLNATVASEASDRFLVAATGRTLERVDW